MINCFDFAIQKKKKAYTVVVRASCTQRFCVHRHGRVHKRRATTDTQRPHSSRKFRSRLPLDVPKVRNLAGAHMLHAAQKAPQSHPRADPAQLHLSTRDWAPTARVVTRTSRLTWYESMATSQAVPAMQLSARGSDLPKRCPAEQARWRPDGPCKHRNHRKPTLLRHAVTPLQPRQLQPSSRSRCISPLQQPLRHRWRRAGKLPG